MGDPRAGRSARARRRGLAGAALTLLVAGLTGAPGAARADSFVLKSGEVVDGAIIVVTRNTLIIERAIGGVRQMRIRDIDEVRVDLAPGKQIVGQFLSWADGVYELRSGDELAWVSGSAISGRRPSEQVGGQPLRQRPTPEEPTAAMKAAPAASTSQETGADRMAPARETTVAQKLRGQDRSLATNEEQSLTTRRAMAAKQSPATGEEQRRAAVDKGQGPATGETRSLGIRASVDPGAPGAGDVVFKIELSRPAERTIVLIYGTVDDTAEAGTDYEPKQGVMTLAPGTESAEVQVPLIADRPAGGEKRFVLFLTADPKVAEIVDQRIVATIAAD